MYKLWGKIPPAKIPSSVEIDKSFWDLFAVGDTILDIGCGTGRFCYKAKTLGLNATGIDINKEAIDMINEDAYLEGINARQANILTDEIEGKFDGALLQGLLCCMTEEERIACLKKVRKLLNGYLHIAEFEMNGDYRERYLEDEKITGEYGTLAIRDKETNEVICHSHNFYEQELKELLEKTGFNIVSIKKTKFTSYHKEKKPGIMIIAK